MRSVPLRDIAVFIRGVTFKPSDVSSAGVALMRTKNVQATLDLSDVMRIPARLVKRGEQYLQAGDTLVSSANSWSAVGKACWIPELPEPLAIGGFVTALRPISDSVDPRFLFHWFTAPRTQATLRSLSNQTTNISNLNLKLAAQMEVPLPSLGRQRRIAAILDQADAIRAKRRQVLVHLDMVTQSIFHGMFGDPIANLSERPVDVLRDWIDPDRPITYGILKPGPDVTGGVPYVRVADMKNRGIRVEGVRCTTAEIAVTYRRSTLRSGDLLMSIRGHVGRFAFVPDVLAGANITQDSARLAVRDPDCGIYLRAAMESPAIQRWMAQRTKGAAVKGINLGDLRELPIPVPSTDEIKRFTAVARVVEDRRQRAGSAIGTVDMLFESLQSHAFKGEL